MKRFTQFVSLVLVLSMILAVPAFAAESSARASDYFGRISCYLVKTTNMQFQVWFDVTATKGMDELGTSVITVQRSSDTVNWTDMQTYTKEVYSQMTATGTGNHSDYVTYTATPGYYYRAYVEFYAKLGNGSATYSDYTSYIKM